MSQYWDFTVSAHSQPPFSISHYWKHLENTYAHNVHTQNHFYTCFSKKKKFFLQFRWKLVSTLEPTSTPWDFNIFTKYTLKLCIPITAANDVHLFSKNVSYYREHPSYALSKFQISIFTPNRVCLKHALHEHARALSHHSTARARARTHLQPAWRSR